MTGQSRTKATNRLVEIITGHATARAQHGADLVGHSLWRLGTDGLVLVTGVTRGRWPFR